MPSIREQLSNIEGLLDSMVSVVSVRIWNKKIRNKMYLYLE